ncbi:hypothetical protein V8E53_002946 [Lactarius tabidus]
MGTPSDRLGEKWLTCRDVMLILRFPTPFVDIYSSAVFVWGGVEFRSDEEAMISGSVVIVLDGLLMAKLGFSWIRGIPPMDYLTEHCLIDRSTTRSLLETSQNQSEVEKETSCVDC